MSAWKDEWMDWWTNGSVYILYTYIVRPQNWHMDIHSLDSYHFLFFQCVHGHTTNTTKDCAWHMLIKDKLCSVFIAKCDDPFVRTLDGALLQKISFTDTTVQEFTYI